MKTEKAVQDEFVKRFGHFMDWCELDTEEDAKKAMHKSLAIILVKSEGEGI